MYQISHTIADIEVADYIRGYRDADKFIAYCKQCNRYDAYWACPPFHSDTNQYISVYKHAYLIGTKIKLGDAMIKECSTPAWCKDISYRIIEEVRRKLDNRLLELEREYPGSRSFFAGTCHWCASCTRAEGKPCIYPDKIRPSLEAIGFDISKTSSELLHIELKWSKEGMLPEYFTLVSGFFTNADNPLITLVK